MMAQFYAIRCSSVGMCARVCGHVYARAKLHTWHDSLGAGPRAAPTTHAARRSPVSRWHTLHAHARTYTTAPLRGAAKLLDTRSTTVLSRVVDEGGRRYGRGQEVIFYEKGWAGLGQHAPGSTHRAVCTGQYACITGQRRHTSTQTHGHAHTGIHTPVTTVCTAG